MLQYCHQIGSSKNVSPFQQIQNVSCYDVISEATFQGCRAGILATCWYSVIHSTLAILFAGHWDMNFLKFCHHHVFVSQKFKRVQMFGKKSLKTSKLKAENYEI